MNNFLGNVREFCGHVKANNKDAAWEAYRKIEAPLGPHYRSLLLSAWTLYERRENIQMIDKALLSIEVECTIDGGWFEGIA